MKEKKPKSEGRIQAEAYEWFNNTFTHLRGLLYHVPNGELRDKITAAKLKAMGVVPGIPDIVFHYRQRTYFFEFKKPGETISKDQKKIHKQLDLQRFVVWVVDNLEEFKYLIESIISDRDSKITLGMTREEYNYRHKIFEYIYGMDMDVKIEIEKITSKETRKNFMYYVTEFIVETFDKQDGFELLFSDDYKYIYKTKLD